MRNVQTLCMTQPIHDMISSGGLRWRWSRGSHMHDKESRSQWW